MSSFESRLAAEQHEQLAATLARLVAVFHELEQQGLVIELVRDYNAGQPADPLRGLVIEASDLVVVPWNAPPETLGTPVVPPRGSA